MLLTLLHIVEWILRSLSSTRKGKATEGTLLAPLEAQAATRTTDTTVTITTEAQTSPNSQANRVTVASSSVGSFCMTIADSSNEFTSTTTEASNTNDANLMISSVSPNFQQTTRIIRRNENPNKIVNTTCRSQQLLPSFVKPIPRLSLPQKQSYVQNAVENRICNGHGPMPLSPERALRSRENIPSISIECLVSACQIFFFLGVLCRCVVYVCRYIVRLKIKLTMP